MTGSVTDDGAPVSPCTGVCRLDARGYCEGCLRSGDEIMAWPGLDAAGQRAILNRLAARRQHRPRQKVNS